MATISIEYWSIDVARPEERGKVMTPIYNIYAVHLKDRVFDRENWTPNLNAGAYVSAFKGQNIATTYKKVGTFTNCE